MFYIRFYSHKPCLKVDCQLYYCCLMYFPIDFNMQFHFVGNRTVIINACNERIQFRVALTHNASIYG